MTPRTRPPRLWVSSAEAARLAGVSRQRIYALVVDGELRSKSLGSRGVLVLLDDLAKRYELQPTKTQTCSICKQPMQRPSATGFHRACARAARKEGRSEATGERD